MENLLIHNCICSHTNCFIQKYCLSCFFFIWIYCGKQRDGRINGLNVWTCMKDVCEYFASNTLLSEYVLMTWLIFCAMMMTFWNCDAIHEEALTLWMWLLTTLNINIVVCAMLCCSSYVEVVEVLRVFCKMSWNSECVCGM